MNNSEKDHTSAYSFVILEIVKCMEKWILCRFTPLDIYINLESWILFHES